MSERIIGFLSLLHIKDFGHYYLLRSTTLLQQTTVSTNILTVQDIIISNPLKSSGVVELEIVVLYTDGGSVITIKIHMYVFGTYLDNISVCVNSHYTGSHNIIM